jgi:K+-sensing histidine kinase KdpD
MLQVHYHVVYLPSIIFIAVLSYLLCKKVVSSIIAVLSYHLFFVLWPYSSNRKMIYEKHFAVPQSAFLIKK